MWTSLKNKHILSAMKLLEKWDYWVYARAYNSLKRICERNPGFGYLMELHLRDWNKQSDISESLKKATETFYKSYKK